MSAAFPHLPLEKARPDAGRFIEVLVLIEPYPIFNCGIKFFSFIFFRILGKNSACRIGN
jgi:hypothetical protein